MFANIPLVSIATRANSVITDYVRSIVRDFSRAVKRHKRTSKRTTILNWASGFHGQVSSIGNAASMLGFDHSFTVPPGGFRPKHSRAFAMEKPEGIVFRSRTYNRKGGMTIRRTGTHSDAVRSQITSLRGKRRQQSMTDAMAGQVSSAIAHAYKYELENVPGTTVTVTTSGIPHLAY